ncbi:MAG: MgtC/SapB family protein [Candidatus Binatia bacterium]
MIGPDSLIVRLAVALGVGLLIGLERERRKGSGPSRGPAGVRTFALTSLAGALSLTMGGEAVLVAAALFVALLASLAYRRSAESDPGITTEMALLTTLLLGALSMREPAVASGLGVVVAILLASRKRLHRFIRGALTEQELHDALLFAAAALIVLPIAPDRPVGPYGVLNPQTLWRLVVLLLGIQALGHIAVRALGVRFGLPLAGLASGFVSSAATIAAFGARARRERAVTGAAVSGAVLSTVATIVQMILVLWAASPPVLAAMTWPLTLAGVVAAGYGAAFAVRGPRRTAAAPSKPGRAFELGSALLFVATIAVVLMAAAALDDALGHAGLLAAAALAGFVDTHAAAISVASLVSVGRLEPADAVLPILAGLSTNTLTKMVLSATAGGARFAWQIVPGLIAVVGAAWGGLLLKHLSR